jgi:transcriptional regulator with XRE-family HTH domain
MNAQATVGRMSRPRTKVVDTSDPRGQLGVYLRHWLDKKPDPPEAIEAVAGVCGVTTRAVTKWCEGESGPDLAKLNLLAIHMGFADWSKLATAAVRFASR